MKKIVLAAAAALLSVTATAATAATPLTVTYSGSLSGINTTYNLPFDVQVILTGVTTQEDAADGSFDYSSFTTNYNGDVGTLTNASGSFAGGVFRILAGGTTFADFSFTGGFPANFATGTDYAVTVGGGAPIMGPFGSAVINGGTGVVRGDLVASAVPEPATWAMMMLGMGMIGFALRSRRNGKVTTKVSFA